MQNNILTTLLSFIFCIVLLQNAYSQVLVEGTNSFGIVTVPEPLIAGNTGFTNVPGNEITSGTISTVAGNAGDYEIVICAVNLYFVLQGPNNPSLSASVSDITVSPGDWDLLATSAIPSNMRTRQNAGLYYVFGRFTDNETPENITCSWVNAPTPQQSGPQGTFVSNQFAAGYFRYSGVDQADPIIDVGCRGTPITTEANSQVMCVGTQNIFTQAAGFEASRAEQTASIHVDLTAFYNFARGTSTLDVTTELFENEGTTDPCEIITREGSFPGCLIALRYAPPPPPPPPAQVPTLSEWGLLAMASILGIFGVLATRRKKAAT